jgi:site-specific recombinase XerD
VRFIADWLEETGRPATLDSLTRVNVKEWLAVQRERIAQGTLRTHWVGLNRFLGWLVVEGELDANPMDGMRKPPLPEVPVPVITDEELKAWIAACRVKTGKNGAFRALRDEAILRSLLDCGTRVSELCGWTVEGEQHVDLDNEMVLVHGKGAKVRPVYFGVRTARALDKYKRARARSSWAHLNAWWIGERGAMSVDGIRDVLKVRGEIAVIQGKLNPHRFRHTFAHDFMLSGGDSQDLKRLAGWSSDAMLARYGASGADVRARAASKRLSRGDRV